MITVPQCQDLLILWLLLVASTDSDATIQQNNQAIRKYFTNFTGAVDAFDVYMKDAQTTAFRNQARAALNHFLNYSPKLDGVNAVSPVWGGGGSCPLGSATMIQLLQQLA